MSSNATKANVKQIRSRAMLGTIGRWKAIRVEIINSAGSVNSAAAHILVQYPLPVQQWTTTSAQPEPVQGPARRPAWARGLRVRGLKPPAQDERRWLGITPALASLP